MSTESFIPLYTPLEKLPVARPRDRLEIVRSLCAGKNVLDLGAMDETAYLSKRGSGTWLHEEIASVAQRVVGLDSSTLVPEAGLQTFPNAVIHRADIANLGQWFSSEARDGFTPDVVVAGELIEHLANPLQFLQGIKNIDAIRGRTLLITTPNATAIHNCLVGLTSRESTHQDHLCIFSFKTLTTLFRRANFDSWCVCPYYARFPEMISRQSGLRQLAVRSGEKGVNMFEYLFPMLSFGYVVRAKI